MSPKYFPGFCIDNIVLRLGLLGAGSTSVTYSPGLLYRQYCIEKRVSVFAMMEIALNACTCFWSRVFWSIGR
jgi:hypothetical protein